MATHLQVEITGTSIVQAAGQHPNKMKFKGVLLPLDEPSDKPPNGSHGHKILVPREVAEKRLSTLIGMGLNYSPELDTHNQKRKVGVIESAHIDGKDVWVEGTIWKHDFPEAQRDLKRDGLGMSMELGSVVVEDVDADVWTLQDFYFLGATILYKDNAAYYKTTAIAASREKGNMKKIVRKAATDTPLTAAQIAGIAAQSVAEQFGTLTQTIAQQGETLAEIQARLDVMDAKKEEEEDDEEAQGVITPTPATTGTEVVPRMTTKKKVEAKKEEDDEEDEEACGMKGAGKGDAEEEQEEEEEEQEEEENMESAYDTGGLEKMGPDTSESEDGDLPGDLNKGTKNKGRKSASEDKLGKTIQSSRVIALRNQVRHLAGQLRACREKRQKLQASIDKMTTQMAAAAETTTRRSIPAELSTLLQRNNFNPAELMASGQKLTVQDVDAVLASVGANLDATTRIRIKTEFARLGMMDEGRVERGGITLGNNRR